ncbi:unnamed protein product, partial [Ectocarpus sp. 13 AM-2016]
QAYGKHTFLITTFKPVPAGTEGAVSLEGTLAGVVGSVIISGFAAAAGVVTAKVRLPPANTTSIANSIADIPISIELFKMQT